MRTGARGRTLLSRSATCSSGCSQGPAPRPRRSPRGGGRAAGTERLPGVAPLGDDEFAGLMARLGPWPRDRRVMVGVSGGPDSMALTLLLARWGRPFACVVDHRLRAEAAD